MTEAFTVDIHGLDELDRKLSEELPAVARAHMKEALKAGAVIAEEAISEEAPTGEYGWLRGTMTSVPETHIRGGVDSAAVRVGPASDLYDPTPRVESTPKPASVITEFVEFGTVHDRPNAFMTRAFERVEAAVADAMIEKLKEIVK